MIKRSEYGKLKFDTEYFDAEEDLMINDPPGTIESVCLFWRSKIDKTYYYGKRCRYCVRHHLGLLCSDAIGVKFAPKEIAEKVIIQTEKLFDIEIPDGLH